MAILLLLTLSVSICTFESTVRLISYATLVVWGQGFLELNVRYSARTVGTQVRDEVLKVETSKVFVGFKVLLEILSSEVAFVVLIEFSEKVEGVKT